VRISTSCAVLRFAFTAVRRREPGFLEIIRAIAMMPEATRSVIEAFSALAHDQATVTAHLDSRGVLTASVQAAKTVALAQYAAANDTDDVPHLLN
jgi:hypothetical protein